MALFIALICSFTDAGVSDFNALVACGSGTPVPVQLCFVIAACSKSAQFGFTGWLLSAMEGPTPVSALMHAATLVTAGVVLLIKLNGIFSDWVVVLIFIVGSFTAIFSGIGACTERDLKQIVALSTASQMGVAFIFIGLCDAQLAFIHIAAHAVFKSLLFWGVGLLNHAGQHQY